MINHDLISKYTVSPDYILGSAKQKEFIKWVETWNKPIKPPNRFYTMKQFCNEGYNYKSVNLVSLKFEFGVEELKDAQEFKRKWKGKYKKVRNEKEKVL